MAWLVSSPNCNCATDSLTSSELMACMMPTKGATLHNSMMGSPVSWPASSMDSGIAGSSGPRFDGQRGDAARRQLADVVHATLVRSGGEGLPAAQKQLPAPQQRSDVQHFARVDPAELPGQGLGHVRPQDRFSGFQAFVFESVGKEQRHDTP